MKSPRKFWLKLAAGMVLAMALLFLAVAFWPQQSKRMATPPPGPHQAGDIWLADLGGKATMAMVWCPPGKFLMGSPVSEPGRLSNETQHEVTLTLGFWLGKYEVTQAQWQALMGKNPARFKEKKVVWKHLWRWNIPIWRHDFLPGYRNLPVESVNWNDSQAFCRQAGLGFRLPTEAEWEYACRAGSSGPYAGTGVLGEMAWHPGNSGGKTHRVGSKRPNAWGLYDMHGNVGEWCLDLFGRYPPSMIDPVGTGEYQFLRGGSWVVYEQDCRSARRSLWTMGGYPLSHTGVRVAFAPMPGTGNNAK
jgi:formylglycine-generating enzyme required for sulfatase activity